MCPASHPWSSRRKALGEQWEVTLRAVDGDSIADVPARLHKLPEGSTHLIVSVGGNDAMGNRAILERKTRDAAEIFRELAEIQQRFCADYQDMLEQVVACRLPTAVCTIYDEIPFPDYRMRQMVKVALSVFNDCIIRAASRQGVPALELRDVCREPTDFSQISPIEPSCDGGAKIAYAIARLLRDHDFDSRQTAIYSGSSATRSG